MQSKNKDSRLVKWKELQKKKKSGEPQCARVMTAGVAAGERLVADEQAADCREDADVPGPRQEGK
jgi:hypothetical protein